MEIESKFLLLDKEDIQDLEALSQLGDCRIELNFKTASKSFCYVNLLSLSSSLSGSNQKL